MWFRKVIANFPAIADSEDDRGYKPKDVDSLSKLEKAKKGLSPGVSRRIQSANYLVLTQQDQCQTSDLQNYKMINLCNFKPLTLCSLLEQQ